MPILWQATPNNCSNTAMPAKRIIRGESDADGHWSVWFTDAPQTAFGGPSPLEALARLFATLDPPIDFRDIQPLTDWPSTIPGFFEVSLGSNPCPDCNGSGRYVGFQAVEQCVRCQGRGRVRLQSNRSQERH